MFKIRFIIFKYITCYIWWCEICAFEKKKKSAVRQCSASNKFENYYFFLTSRYTLFLLNWFIFAPNFSAIDYLILLLCCLQWLALSFIILDFYNYHQIIHFLKNLKMFIVFNKLLFIYFGLINIYILVTEKLVIKLSFHLQRYTCLAVFMWKTSLVCQNWQRQCAFDIDGKHYDFNLLSSLSHNWISTDANNITYVFQFIFHYLLYTCFYLFVMQLSFNFIQHFSTKNEWIFSLIYYIRYYYIF